MDPLGGGGLCITIFESEVWAGIHRAGEGPDDSPSVKLTGGRGLKSAVPLQTLETQSEDYRGIMRIPIRDSVGVVLIPCHSHLLFCVSKTGGPKLPPQTPKRIQNMEPPQYEPITTLGKLGDY